MKDESVRAIIMGRFLSNVREIDAFLDGLGDAEAKVVMEAIGSYGRICDEIESPGHRVLPTHPLKLRALTTGRAKNDKNDAEMLAELLRINAVPTSYVPQKGSRKLNY